MNKTNNISYTFGRILKVVVPLVLTSLSGNLMYVVDKMIIAYYSIDAMNAIGISGNIATILTYMFVNIANTAEIYVGQYNGANQIENLAKPVWQMIYLSLLANVFFIPMGIFAEHVNVVLPECYKADGIAYQSILTYFGSFQCLFAAIAAFFIGQGKTAIVTAVVLSGNLLNAALDIVFIFGIKGIIPELGSVGAALATIMSEFIQFLVMLLLFLNRNGRVKFNTLKNRKFDKTIFMGCLKIGAPMSIGKFLEVIAWYLVYAILGHVSKEMATAHGMLCTVFVLFFGFSEGLNKGIAALSANLIGMKNFEGIRKLLKNFTIVTLSVGGIVAIPLVLFPEFVFRFFDTLGEDISSIYPILNVGFRIIVLNIIVESLGGILWGVLMSGGDTRYPITVNLSLLWIILVIPMSIMYFMGFLDSALTSWKLCLAWEIGSLLLIYRRYRSLKWYNKLV